MQPPFRRNTDCMVGCGNGGLVVLFPFKIRTTYTFSYQFSCLISPISASMEELQAGRYERKLGLWLSISGMMMSFKGFLTAFVRDALPQIFKCLVPAHSDLSLHATSKVSWLTKVATFPGHPRYHIVLFSSPFVYFCLAACLPLQG